MQGNMDGSSRNAKGVEEGGIPSSCGEIRWMERFASAGVYVAAAEEVLTPLRDLVIEEL